MATTHAITATPRVRGTVLLAFALLAAAGGTHAVRERAGLVPPDLAPTLWMRSPGIMDRLALSFDDVVADVYWIRAVVYYGSVRRSRALEKNYDLLYPLLDITTTLDPRFLLAYRMGAIFLSEPYPGGAGRPDQAIALLEKGVRYDPNRWQLLHDIGFVHFWASRDYVKAAEWMNRAAAVQGAPIWLRTTAAGMLARGGQRETARALWREMLSADSDTMRLHAQMRLGQLAALDQVDALESLVGRATAANGRRPATWSDLVGRGWLRGVPRDPAGVPYVLDRFTGRVTVSERSPIFPLPDYPAHP